MSVQAVEHNFEELVLKAAGPVLVDFWAPWCGYCRRLSPAVDRLAGAWEGKVQVVKVDIDQEEAVAARYQVETIPTLILFQNGKASEPLVNPASQAVIEGWLRENGVQ